MNFELRQGGKGDRPMNVDMLPDEASTRSQRRGNLKGEGYIMFCYLITFIWSNTLWHELLFKTL
ncbi:hypothetical protein [Candidatus Regiella insecticola]|uniref:hypothetical protein n=1 Tax=Candidatus Regiella insecticola TaxID=138073 RepID=UPI0002F04AAF|nr:hypothetical protein [Candidatus Regiella insecticola]